MTEIVLPEEEIKKLGREAITPGVESSMMQLQVRSSLIDKVKETQFQDEVLCKLRDQILAGTLEDFSIADDGALGHDTRLCVPAGDLRDKLMKEAHHSQYSIHP